MNITHVVENLNRGGLERMVIDLVRLQQAEGHRCQVVCVFEHGPLAPELQVLGVPVLACDKRRGLDLLALRRLRRAVRGHATEVMHTHNAVAHYLAVLATRGLRIRRVLNTRHGMGVNRRAVRREWLYRRALFATDKVIAVCEAARLDAVKRGIAPSSKACVVTNGIRVDAFSPASTERRQALRLSLGVAASTRLIGSVGRLNWTKNQAGLIRAFALLQNDRPDVALVLIGDGELREELRCYAADEGVTDRVFFLGDRNDVHQLLPGLDLFVLSSLSEGYSMALLEACASGLPIIATAVGGNGEIVRDGVTGVLVPTRDPMALAAAMHDLLDDPVCASTLAGAARAWVEVEGSLVGMARNYDALYGGITR